MLPSAIIKWAERYDLDPAIVWEMIEVTTDGEDLGEIRDETHLFDLTVEWVTAMIDMTYEDPTRSLTQSFLLYYVPVVFALAPYLMTDQRERIMIAAGTDTPILTDALHIVLDLDARPNR